MTVTATFKPPPFSFIPKDPHSTTTAYQCVGQSQLRPEIFTIYYYMFRHTDPNPTPEIIGKWKIKQRNKQENP